MCRVPYIVLWLTEWCDN